MDPLTQTNVSKICFFTYFNFHLFIYFFVSPLFLLGLALEEKSIYNGELKSSFFHFERYLRYRGSPYSVVSNRAVPNLAWIQNRTK